MEQMTQLRTSRGWRTLTWLLTVAMITSLVPLCTIPGAAQAQQPDLRTYLVMPTVDQSGTGVTYLPRMVMDELALALAGQPGTAAIEFRATTPIIQRALEEGRVLPVQVEAGTTTPSAAIQLAQALDADAVILTTVDSAVTTDSPRQVKIVLTGSVFSVATNYDEQAKEVSATPQADHTFKFIGASPALAGYQGSDRSLYRDAAVGAVRQIVDLLVGRRLVVEGGRRGASSLSWLGWIVGAGLVALLVANKGTSHTPADALAPIPVSQQVQANGILLTWNPPPPTTLVLFKYQIQRSRNGSAFQFIDGGTILAGQTSHFDPDLLSGQYVYRIRAVYTDQSVSPYANFTGVDFTAE